MHELKDIVNTIHTADCLTLLRTMPEGCVDVLVTDPPYGLAFMGKDWDKALPGIEVWQECLRVLKPGAFAFVMSIPRSDCYARMIGRLIKAGFDVSFTPIFWAYATGFPKAMNVAKATMKKVGDPGEVIGTERIDVGIQSGSMHAGRTSKLIQRDIRVPTDPRAKTLEGSYGGFQPKPAVEIIIVAMKPMSKKTFIDQALKNRKGVTWLDDCRIPYLSDEDKPKDTVAPGWSAQDKKNAEEGYRPKQYTTEDFDWKSDQKGRFPANLLVNDDVLDDGQERKSTGGINEGKLGKRVYGTFKNETIGTGAGGYGDAGSFSRYFDLDKWWVEQLRQLPESVQRVFPFLIVPKAGKSEKNAGVGTVSAGHVVKMTQHGGAWLCECGRKYAAGLESCPRCGSTERELYEVGSRPVGNTHPTVKPLKLMSYLVTLGSREGDVVLDPFVGSGTTALAARLLGRRFLAIEINPEYVEIAKARLSVLDAAQHHAEL